MIKQIIDTFLLQTFMKSVVLKCFRELHWCILKIVHFSFSTHMKNVKKKIFLMNSWLMDE